MDVCYDGNLALVMPKNYVDVSRDEMEYIDGGNPLAIVASAIGIGLGCYQAGQWAGEKLYYAGYQNAQYQKWKILIRGTVFAALPFALHIFMLGLENKYYFMASISMAVGRHRH